MVKVLVVEVLIFLVKRNYLSVFGMVGRVVRLEWELELEWGWEWEFGWGSVMLLVFDLNLYVLF